MQNKAIKTATVGVVSAVISGVVYWRLRKNNPDLATLAATVLAPTVTLIGTVIINKD